MWDQCRRWGPHRSCNTWQHYPIGRLYLSPDWKGVSSFVDVKNDLWVTHAESKRHLIRHICSRLSEQLPKKGMILVNTSSASWFIRDCHPLWPSLTGHYDAYCWYLVLLVAVGTKPTSIFHHQRGWEKHRDSMLEPGSCLTVTHLPKFQKWFGHIDWQKVWVIHHC